jgi:hypothetical protein
MPPDAIRSVYGWFITGIYEKIFVYAHMTYGQIKERLHNKYNVPVENITLCNYNETDIRTVYDDDAEIGDLYYFIIEFNPWHTMPIHQLHNFF